jgi:hypothetical protein
MEAVMRRSMSFFPQPGHRAQSMMTTGDGPSHARQTETISSVIPETTRIGGTPSGPPHRVQTASPDTHLFVHSRLSAIS